MQHRLLRRTERQITVRRKQRARLSQLRRVQEAAVIFFIVFDKRQALAHDGSADDHTRRILGLIGRAESVVQRRRVMSVDAQNLPAVGGVAFRKMQRQNRVDIAAALQAVIIHKRGERAELVFRGQRHRLGDLALVVFTVSHKDERVAGIALRFCGQRHAAADGQALSQTAAAPIHAARGRGGVALIPPRNAAVFPEQRIARDITHSRKHGIHSR